MRVRVIALSVIIAGVAILDASPGRPEDRTAAQSHQIPGQSAIAPLSQFVEQIPDGAELIDLYKAARTVTDVEAANGKVKEQVVSAQSVAADLVRLHDAKMAVCEDVEQSHLEATAARAKVFSDALARIDSELTKSLATMRQRVAAERSTSTRAKDDVNRFTVAAHEFGKLNLHTQELAKAIQGVARNIRTTAESCVPTPIPPLFAAAGTPSSRVVSLTRSRPTPRKRPANAAARRAPLLFRYYYAHRGLSRLISQAVPRPRSFGPDLSLEKSSRNRLGLVDLAVAARGEAHGNLTQGDLSFAPRHVGDARTNREQNSRFFRPNGLIRLN